jgi:hypothetical protein
VAARSTFTRSAFATITAAWANSIRDHLVTIATTDDVSSVGQVAVNTTTGKMVMSNGSVAVEFGRYGAEDTFSLSFTQSFGVPSSNTTWVRRRGRYVDGNIVAAITGNGSTGNPIQVSTNLPVPSSKIKIGDFLYADSGTAFYTGAVLMTTGGALELYVHNSTNVLGAAPSFPMTSGDVFYMDFSYPAANV